VVKADEFGVPQTRQRVFILGLRNDLNLKGLPLIRPTRNSFATVGGVLGDLPRIRSRLSREPDSGESWHDAILGLDRYAFNHLDLRIRKSLRARLESLRSDLPLGKQAMERENEGPSSLNSWFTEPSCDVILNHNSRGHMREDLMRYFFWSHYASVRGTSPRMDDVPHFLRPNHKNLNASETDTDAVKIETNDTPFNDRFRVQVRLKHGLLPRAVTSTATGWVACRGWVISTIILAAVFCQHADTISQRISVHVISLVLVYIFRRPPVTSSEATSF